MLVVASRVLSESVADLLTHTVLILNIIRASLSEPCTDEVNIRSLYIIILYTSDMQGMMSGEPGFAGIASLPGNVAACFVAIAMKTSLLCSFLPC